MWGSGRRLQDNIEHRPESASQCRLRKENHSVPRRGRNGTLFGDLIAFSEEYCNQIQGSREQLEHVQKLIGANLDI